MKTNAIIRIVLFSVTILVLLGILLTGLGFVSYRDRTQESSTGTASHSAAVSAAGISRLEIEWAAGDITISPKAGIQEIQFSEDSRDNAKHTLYYKTSGSKLTIQFSEEPYTIHFGINMSDITSKDLTVYVPESWVCDELKMEVASANVEIQNMVIRQIEFDGASGNCDFTDCTVDYLDIDTASGDVTFSGTLDNLDFDAASANFWGELRNTPSDINMDGMSGELDLTLPEDCGYTVALDGLSCGFHSEFGYAEQRDGRYVHGDGSCRIDVDGMSCDVIIRSAAAASPAASSSGHHHTEDCTNDPESCPDYAESHHH